MCDPGRRGVWMNVSMKRFMALLSKNENKDPPQAKLLDLAGQLCGDLQSVSPSLEKLVEAMMGCKLQEYFLTNVKCCKVKEKKELVQLWNEIHYTDSLVSVQKFRYRKRIPPPVSLCPEGRRKQMYSKEVLQTLHRFAATVTMNPNKDQRDTLVQDTNLKPRQVYYWFANYRRRQRAQLRQLEKLISSTNEEPSTRQAKHQPNSGFFIPQSADAFHAGVGSEQKESNTLMPCGPGWEQSAVGLDYSADGTYSTLLESSFLQSSALQEMSSTKTSATPVNMEEPAAFCTKAENSIRKLENFVLHFCGSHPFQSKHLDTRQPAPSAGVVSGESSQGPMCSPDTEGVRASMSKVPGGGCIEASSENISHQTDLELESFVLREGQLGSLEAILPHSSPQAVLGKSQCPSVSTPHLEEIQALGHSQVLENPLIDPMTDDTLWGAWLLFQFSVGGRM